MTFDTEFWLEKPNGEIDLYKLVLLGSVVLLFVYLALTTLLF